ncbi:peptidase domain-containing ABC transporter [Mucilaginibacter sp. CSA2-8R]|uniref:peptidase domain-containing ABC transporter n=1 Tax=Mucilaginibacter sp. CSA2-8R TaxID=3141542 RepID=UPI00315C6109
MKKFPFFKQLDIMDCGPTCIKIVAKFYGKNFSIQKLRGLTQINRDGVSLFGISDAAEQLGFRTRAVKRTVEQIKEVNFPSILYWKQNHFVVIFEVKDDKYLVADPARGIITYSKQEFSRNWLGDEQFGIVLMLLPTPSFHVQDDDKATGIKWSFLWRYLLTYKSLIIQLVFGLCIGSLLQLLTPYLTQSIVDVGISTANISFIYIILLAQVVLVIGRVSVDFIRSWILLHISTRINVSILTDFLIKLMKLPISFFDTKLTGDIMQRMTDQRKIENFLTGSALSTVFSLFNLLIFSIALISYNLTIFFVFAIFSSVYMAWIGIFMKRRRELNFKSFDISARNQSSIMQLINGMQEIKLNNCEKQKRWEWEHIQAQYFRYNVKSLSLSQYQQGGAAFINESKNLIITFLSAKAVIYGDLTLGAMVAVQYIIGQLNSPIEHLLSFLQGFQDAKISMERLNEIHQLKDEESLELEVNHFLPDNKSITFSDLTFKYPGAGNLNVLKNISFSVPEGKTTAIVGMSGSGKTTILKLLLRFYMPESGSIKVGGLDLANISYKSWRNSCGTVMQEGFIFSDTIEKNIAVGDDYPDRAKLNHAIRIANIQDYISSLPLGLKTKIGVEANGISQGQRQRILIARAVYKDPAYIFFDEATNALDANNERVIMDNLKEFFVNRTVIVVAHRLSTVSGADNIIVLDKGEIIEQGDHASLTAMQGAYFHLVKNQLELGN